MFEIVKNASVAEADQLLGQVYAENPAHWAAGLTRQHFDGGLWLVREASTKKAIGFTGWQVREELGGDGLKKVGYYSIGILPEYRHQGVAKQAVSRMLRDKAAEVDVVRALIHPGNAPSIALAGSLGVEIEKAAAKVDLKAIGKSVKGFLGGPGGAAIAGSAAVPTINDLYLHPGKSLFKKEDWDDKRIADFLTNAGVGAIGGGFLRKGIKDRHAGTISGAGTTLLAAPYVKPLLARLPNVVDAKANELNRPPLKSGGDPSLPLKGALAGGGIVAALAAGLLGKSFLTEARTGNEIAAQQNKGRVKITLPTKDPNDGETQVDMPMDSINLSNNIHKSLGRDTRRRLRGEGGERKKKFLKEQASARNLGIDIADDGQVTKGAA